MRPPDLLMRAAALLQEDAAAEELSCAVGDQKWTCPDCNTDPDGKCQAQRNTEERRKVAAGLLVLASAS